MAQAWVCTGFLPAAALAVAAASALGVAVAQDAPEQAFRRQDYAGALELWTAAAEEGSAEAKLGLGTLYDLGLGVARDPAQAFRWYLEAADEGLADAQFNVAVMLDAGTGVPRDRAAAALWYARAAAAGHVRSQYNLGILYELGDGVDRNLALARAWFTAAAPGLGAARERLDALPAAAPGPLAAPRPVAGTLRDDGGTLRADLVWTAAPEPGGARFAVEIAARRASGGFDPVARTDTALSAIALEVPEGIALLWRVSAVADGDYAASPWRALSDGADAPAGGGEPDAAGAGTGAPGGRVRFDLTQDDAAALVLAAELSVSFRLAGLMIETARLDGAPGRTQVRYAYGADAELARRIAAALPGLSADGAAQADLPGAVPGLVEIAIVGGPAGN